MATYSHLECCLLCQAFFDAYNHTPVLLDGCGDTLCAECHKRLAKESHQIECPFCKKVSTFGTAPQDQLRLNLHIYRLLPGNRAESLRQIQHDVPPPPSVTRPPRGVSPMSAAEQQPPLAALPQSSDAALLPSGLAVYFQQNDGTWKRFYPDAEALVFDALCVKRLDDLHISYGGHTTYHMDFKAMTQTNLTTKKVRKIKMEKLDPTAIKDGKADEKSANPTSTPRKDDTKLMQSIPVENDIMKQGGVMTPLPPRRAAPQQETQTPPAAAASGGTPVAQPTVSIIGSVKVRHAEIFRHGGWMKFGSTSASVLEKALNDLIDQENRFVIEKKNSDGDPASPLLIDLRTKEVISRASDSPWSHKDGSAQKKKDSTPIPEAPSVIPLSYAGHPYDVNLNTWMANDPATGVGCAIRLNLYQPNPGETLDTDHPRPQAPAHKEATGSSPLGPAFRTRAVTHDTALTFGAGSETSPERSTHRQPNPPTGEDSSKPFCAEFLDDGHFWVKYSPSDQQRIAEAIVQQNSTVTLGSGLYILDLERMTQTACHTKVVRQIRIEGSAAKFLGSERTPQRTPRDDVGYHVTPAPLNRGTAPPASALSPTRIQYRRPAAWHPPAKAFKLAVFLNGKWTDMRPEVQSVILQHCAHYRSAQPVGVMTIPSFAGMKVDVNRCLIMEPDQPALPFRFFDSPSQMHAQLNEPPPPLANALFFDHESRNWIEFSDSSTAAVFESYMKKQTSLLLTAASMTFELDFKNRIVTNRSNGDLFALWMIPQDRAWI